MLKLKAFKAWLRTQDYSECTISAYYGAVEYYQKFYKTMNITNLLAFKQMMIDQKNKPQTINVRLQGLNHYNTWDQHPELHVKFVKVPRRMFLEDVLSEADYKHLCRMLKRDEKTDWYFLVKFLACTGARIGEALKFKGEHVVAGYMDIYGKGGKQRRVWIPKQLRKEALTWKTEGLLWDWKSSCVETVFRNFGKSYGIDPHTMHPHAFRHLYARMFYDKTKDIQMLSNILGHDSLNTTMIYLLRTNSEVIDTINEIVTW